MLLDAVEKSGVPSISIAAAENGKVVWEESVGYADKEKKVRATPESLYAQASITKSFTATGLMVLAQRKLVDLDKPVDDYHAGRAIALPLCSGRRRRRIQGPSTMPLTPTAGHREPFTAITAFLYSSANRLLLSWSA